MTRATKTLREAATEVLTERGPMYYRDLIQEILAAGQVHMTSKTPEASLNAMIVVDIKQRGAASTFVRLRPGVFGLRALHSDPGRSVTSVTPVTAARVLDEEDAIQEAASELDETDRRVRTPLFPVYSELRHLLRIWPGWYHKQVTGLRATINELRGTPQSTVDWTEPDRWIPERLTGDDCELALAIWEGSRHAVNPRHIYGHWLLSRQYALIEDDEEGRLRLTERGGDFLEQEGVETEGWLDEQEGLVHLASLVADNGPSRVGGILPEWSAYLERHSRFNSPSTVRDSIRRRLLNLLERGLIDRRGTLYSITDKGLEYLNKKGPVPKDPEFEQLWSLIRKQEGQVRDSLRELLLDMDSYAFEHLVKLLLEEMDYQNVEVTTRSGDGGVDVVADIELGITSVREVVQAKRHKRTIQRKDLDALRGSLYRFNAVRGTLITTSKFSKGTEEAAFAPGTAPITLIDGDKLIDLLIEHGVGIKKRTVEILEVDTDAFVQLESEA